MPSKCTPINSIIAGNELWCKRDDLIHPIISGNKFRKIKGYLEEFYTQQYDNIITVASLHSNYAHAISYLALLLKLPLKIFLYGYPDLRLNATLSDLKEWGIDFEIISRSSISGIERNYRTKSTLFIPEGGDGKFCYSGICDLLVELNSDTSNTAILIASGTGASVRSILENTESTKLITLSPVRSIQSKFSHARLIWLNDIIGIPFAGYSAELMLFIKDFYQKENILLDPIYTSRLLFNYLHSASNLPKFKKVILIHTGGLMGWRNYLERYPYCDNQLAEIVKNELKERV